MHYRAKSLNFPDKADRNEMLKAGNRVTLEIE